ncbi:MAG: hypothetical protein ACLTS1_18625 [Coprococcus sp.]
MTEKVLQEITEKRDRYTKHFMLPEKGTAAAVYPEPVHYETESGWEEIDNRLKQYQRMEKSATRIRHLIYRYVLRSRQERIRL